jgi:glycosyltransferase involved in cell wall biosynthesis
MALEPDLGWQPSLRAAFHGNLHLRDLVHEGVVTDDGMSVVRGRHLPLPGEARRLAYAWARRRFLAALRTPPDIVHDTGYEFAAEHGDRMPVVITVHDLINDESPAYRASRSRSLRAKADAIGRARRIGVPSMATRDTLVRVHGVDADRIDVIPHGSRLPAPGDRDPVGKPYLLHVGGRGGYKDFPTALRAFSRVRRLGFDGVFVNVGGGPWRTAERALLSELRIPPELVEARAADDRALATLYAFARGLVVSSQIEGFGIPILEAMSLGCPVLCMEAPGCAEVAGDAALVAPVADYEALAANMDVLLGSESERSRLARAGRARAATMTWSESARKHIRCYERALGGRCERGR